MLSAKLITLLEAIPTKELGRFRRFVASPYFNEHEEVTALLDYLLPFFRRREVQELKQKGKPMVWKALFGRRPYRDEQLRKLSSMLTRLGMEFLAFRRHWEDGVLQDLLVLETMEHGSLAKHYHGMERKLEKTLEQGVLRDSNFHFMHYRLEESRHRFQEGQINQPKTLTHLEAADHHLECFYLSRKLRNFCDALGYQSFLSVASRISVPEALFGYIEREGYLRVPAVKVYYMTAKMLLHPEEEHFFFSLKDYLQEASVHFSLEEQNALYIFLKNYCINEKINKGHSTYFQQLFEISQAALEKELELNEGWITPQSYKNLITVGLYIKAFDWVERFILEYTERLPEENRDNALRYNLAKVYFSQGQYHRVIGQLREVAFSNHTYALGSKLLLLKTYYEQDEELALDSLADSFRIYLRRNRLISKEVRQQYLNLIRFIRKMSRVRPGDNKAIDRIRLQIRSCTELADKPWVLAKLDDLA